MAYLFKRPDSKYWWVGYLDGGREVRKSLKVASKEAAKTLMAEYQILEAKHHNRSHALSIRKNFEEVIKEYARSRGRENTCGWYEWRGGEFVEFCRKKGIEDIGDVHIATVEEFYLERRWAGKEQEEKKEKKRKEEGVSGGRVKGDPG